MSLGSQVNEFDLTRLIVPYLDAMLPVTFTLTHSLNIRYPNLVLRKTNNIRARIHLIKPRIRQLLLQGEMGLIDPRSPPGPNNPPLRDSLRFFRTSLGSAFLETNIMLISIYIFLRTGRTPYFYDPDIQPVINEIFLPEDRPQNESDIEDYSVVSFNADFNDFLSIRPPEDADLEGNYDADHRIVRNTSRLYQGSNPGDVIYLSDGRTMQVTNAYRPLSMAPYIPPVAPPTAAPAPVIPPLSPPTIVPIIPTPTTSPTISPPIVPIIPAPTTSPLLPTIMISPPLSPRSF